MGKAVIREAIEELDGISRTWFEWGFIGEEWTKTLVIEADVDTDPNSYAILNLLDGIKEQLAARMTTMAIYNVRVVPKL